MHKGNAQEKTRVAEMGSGCATASVKAPRTFDGATCTKVNRRQVSMKESSNNVELN